MIGGLIARVIVAPKPFVPGSQGSAILSDLHALQFTEVKKVSTGKVYLITLDTSSVSDAEKQVRRMGTELLANHIIEDFQFSLRLTNQTFDQVTFDDMLMRLTVRENFKLLDRIDEIGNELHGSCPKRKNESYASMLRVDVKEWLFECTLCGAAGEMIGVIHRLTFPEWNRDQILYWLADVAIWVKPHLLLFRYPYLEKRHTMEKLLEMTDYADFLRGEERNKRELTKHPLASAKARA